MSTDNQKSKTLAAFPIINGKKMPFAICENKEAKRLCGYGLIQHDLQQAELFLKKAIELDKSDVPPDTIREALWISFITKYSKCFTQAKERKVKLEINDILKKEKNPCFKKTHEKIMNIRHTFIAHAGGKAYEGGQVQVVLSPGSTKKILDTKAMGISASSETKISYNEYLKLLKEVQNYIVKQIDKTFPRVEEKIHARPIEEWYKLAIFPRK